MKKIERKKEDNKLNILKTVNITVNMGGSVAAPTTLPCCGSICHG